MQEWLDKYAESHQNSTNKALHWICVPAIFFSVLGLLWSLPAAFLQELLPFMGIYANFATLFVFLCALFYLRLSIPICLGMLFIASTFLWICGYVSAHFSTPLWQISLAIFALAWVGQFIGHKIEGAKPSFFEDLQFLLIGPAWLLSFVYRHLGIKF